LNPVAWKKMVYTGMLVLLMFLACKNDQKGYITQPPRVGLRFYFYSPPTQTDFYDIAYPALSNLWLCGAQGELWNFKNQLWTQYSLGTDQDLTGLHFRSLTVGIVFSEQQIWQYGSTTGWQLRLSGAPRITAACLRENNKILLGKRNGMLQELASDSLHPLKNFSSSVIAIQDFNPEIMVANRASLWRFRSSWEIIYQVENGDSLVAMKWNTPDRGYFITGQRIWEYGRFQNQVSPIDVTISGKWLDMDATFTSPFAVCVGEGSSAGQPYLLYLFDGEEWRSITHPDITAPPIRISLLAASEGWLLGRQGQLIHLSTAQNTP